MRRQQAAELKLPCDLHMGNGDKFDLTITDKRSGLRVAAFQLTPEQMGTLLQTRTVTTDVICLQSENVGMQRELKHEEIWIPNRPFAIRDSESHLAVEARRILDEAMAPFEVDGWIPERYDACNTRNIIPKKVAPDGKANHKDGNWYRVGCFRWVPYTEGESDAREATPKRV